MRLLYHGGLCCGVKTLEGFWNHPDYKLYPLSAPTKPEGMTENRWEMREAWDKNGYQIDSNVPFYHGTRPEETALERLDGYLDHLVKFRPHGMVEALLVRDQWDLWHKHLIERNFHVSCEFKNSNSGRLIRCYQLIYGDDNVARRPKAEKAVKKHPAKAKMPVVPAYPVFLSSP